MDGRQNIREYVHELTRCLLIGCSQDRKGVALKPTGLTEQECVID